MQIKSRHFGILDVDEKKLIHFSQGIIGFPEAKTYSLIRQPDVEPYQWLHCVDRPDLAFVVVPVLFLRPDYQFKMTAENARWLKFRNEDVPVMLAVVVIPQDVREATANLLAPILINERERVGGQLVNEVDGYSTRHLIREELKHIAREGKIHVGADQEKEPVGDVRGRD